MTLHGPAHPEAFRTEVGRYSDRFYHDPLPADDRWGATDEVWPSVSTIKKASAKDWSHVSLGRAARYVHDRRHELDGMTVDEIHARFNEINKSGLNRAAARGTTIHDVAEAYALGREPILFGLSEEAKPYLPVVKAFIDDYQPEHIATEVVCINRLIGYGGTADGILAFGGGRWLIDWKTRKEGKHGVYDEEAMQAAAYANCDYMIVDDNGEAVRRPFPEIDGALIVSLTPEGYRIYPVHLDEAWDGFVDLHNWWKGKQRTMKGKSITLPKNPRTAPSPAVPADPFAGLPDGKDLAWEIRKPVAATPSSSSATSTAPGPSTSSAPASPAPTSGTTSPSPFDDLPMPSTTTAPASPVDSPRDSDGWDQYQADPFTESPEVQAERALQRRLVLRTDGDLVPAGIVESMGQAIQAQKDRNAIYLRWISEAIATGMPLRIKGAPQNTERGQHLADLICCALTIEDTKAKPDDIIRAAVCTALPDVECFAFPTITTGAILTSLNHLEAEAAAGIAQAIRNGEARLSRRRDGSYHVADAA